MKEKIQIRRWDQLNVMDQFFGYYRPRDQDLGELWNSSLIVLDSSVLLNLYRYPRDARDDLLGILDTVSERLWIPHQVALEYHENRLIVIANQLKTFKTVKEIIRTGSNKLIEDLAKLKLQKRHSIIDPKKFLEKLKGLVDDYSKELDRLREAQPDVFQTDELREKIQDLLQGRIGTAFGTQAELDEIYKEGEIRYKYQQPPGYADLNDKKGTTYSYGGLVYKREFGDLILWKQIVNEARTRDEIDKVMFVVDDAKEDWWWIVDSYGKKTIGPRPALVEELVSKAKVSLFYMYRSERFMEYAREYLAIDVKDESIDKVRDVTETSSEIRTERFAPYMKKIIEFFWNNGDPIEASITDLLEKLGPGAYGNHSKLSLAPWMLLQDGTDKSTRCLTSRGIQFATGDLHIPHQIVKDPLTGIWMADEGTLLISIIDL